jgi:DNA-binding MarR family transcriptional regulator
MKIKGPIIKEAYDLAKLAPAMMSNIIRVVNRSGIQETIGFTLEQIKLLIILNYSGPVRLSFLTHEVGVTQGSMTVMVQRLIKKKVLSKSVDPTDKRAVLVHLTSHGETYCQKIYDHFTTLFNEICQDLSQKQRQDFVKSYETLVRIYKDFVVNKLNQESTRPGMFR